MDESSTIAAIATAPGRAGVAVVRVSGPEAWEVARRLTRRPGPDSAPCVAFGRVYDVEGAKVDECVVLHFRAPRSYTGEDTVEFQCHGGVVTPRRVLEACLNAGARLARRGEFTERAFLNGKIDYSQAEAVIELIEAKTARAADRALLGLDGSGRADIRRLYDEAVEISATIEHSLDVDEGELPEGFLERVGRDIAGFGDKVAEAVKRRREGRLLSDGALVVLAGPPNAGKSSLMNVLLGENRAIVSDIAGTTRDSIEEWLDIEGWPVRLTDTAGIRDSDDTIEQEGVRRAESLAGSADVVVWLGEGDLEGVDPGRVVKVRSKCDLGRREGVLNISSLTGEGIDELKSAVAARLAAQAENLDDAGTEYSGDLSVLDEVRRMLDFTCEDIVLIGNQLRLAADRLGGLVGAVYSADMLERLFSRFCVGK